MKIFFDPKIGFGLVCLSLFFGCSKAEVVDPVDMGIHFTKASSVFYDDFKAGAIVASYASHDSVWHMNLTLEQALALKITKDQYEKTVSQMEEINALIRKDYSEGRTVVFVESVNASPLSVADDRILGIMSITNSNTTGSAVFSSRASSVRMSVSSYPEFYGIDFGGGTTVYGRSGEMGSISSGGTYDSASSKYNWNLSAVSVFTLRDGYYITVTFIE